MASLAEYINVLRARRSDIARAQLDYLNDCQRRHPTNGLTAAEQAHLDRLDAELGDLTEQIDRYDRDEARQVEGAASRLILDRILGGANRAPGPSLGERLRDAIGEVREGRSTASVAIEDRALEEGGAAGYGVPTQLAAPVTTLRAASIVLGLPGLVTVPMTSDRIRFPRIGADTASGLTESQQITDATVDVDAVDLLAQKFGVIQYITSELQEDMSADALQVFGTNMLEALARKVDYGMLEGLGNNDLVGIRNVSGANSTSAAALPADFVKFRTAEYELRLDNARPRCWVMHPRSWFNLGGIKSGLSGDVTTIIAPDPTRAAGDSLLGYPVYLSTQITLTEGATSVGSWAALLDTSQIVVGVRRPATLEVSREFRFDRDQIAVRATWRGALGVLNPEAISLVTDIRNA